MRAAEQIIISALGGAGIQGVATRGLGINLGNTPGTDTPLFTTFLGRAPRIQNVFFDQTSKANFTASVSFECSTFTGISACWSVPLCAGTDTLTNANNGDYDAIWLACAQGIKAGIPAGEATWIRIGWEFNISGQPWNAVTLGAAAYISAWTRCVAIFRSVSPRFRFVWCSNCSAVADNGFDAATAYPGDSLADAVGVDLYERTGDTTANNGLDIYNFRLAEDRGLTRLAGFAATHGKAICLPEWGCQDNTVPVFASMLSQWIVSNVLPTKGFHSYWNRDDGGIACKISTGERPAIAAAYQQYFGPPVITSADLSVLQNTPGSLTLASNQDGIYTETWAITGGAGAASFTIAGNVLSWGSVAASTKAVTVSVTTSEGLTTNKTLNITFVVPYVFVNAEAAAYVARFTNTPAQTREPLIDALFGSLKLGATSGTNIYAKAKEFWLLANQDAQASLLGCTNVSNATATNAPPFVTDRGWTPNLTGVKLLSTNILTNAASPFTQNSASFGIWSLTDLASNSGAIGNGAESAIDPWSASNTHTGFTNDFTNWSSASSTSKGLFISNRSAAAAKQLYVNGASVETGAAASTGPSANIMIIGAATPSFPEARQIAFAWMGGSLNAAEQLDLYNAVQTYLHALGAV